MTHPSRKDLNNPYDSFAHNFVDSLPVNHPNVEKAIALLEEIEDFDGETMEYIITQLHMREQMLKQLMGTCDWADVVISFEERRNYHK